LIIAYGHRELDRDSLLRLLIHRLRIAAKSEPGHSTIGSL
jgi:hypothetical protein